MRSEPQNERKAEEHICGSNLSKFGESYKNPSKHKYV